MVCGKDCEVYSRIVGYFRPVHRWNIGKKEEFKDRVVFAAESNTEFIKEKPVIAEVEL